MTITEIAVKVRALVDDLLKTDKECFTYANSAVFTIAESNVVEIVSVSQHYAVLPSGETSYDHPLESGEYSFDTTNNELTVSSGILLDGDIVTVTYTYYKYSATEMESYILAAMSWISVYGGSDDYDFVVGSGDELDPVPTSREGVLIALVAAIIIKPDYNSYRAANLSVSYPRMEKDEKIQRTIRQFLMGRGVCDLLEFDENDYYYFWKI